MPHHQQGSTTQKGVNKEETVAGQRQGRINTDLLGALAGRNWMGLTATASKYRSKCSVLFPFGGIDGVVFLAADSPHHRNSPLPSIMKFTSIIVALQWAALCFVPATAQDISQLGTLLSNVQQYASLASQILSFAQPFLGGTNTINQDVGTGSTSPSGGLSSLLSSYNSYPQSGSDSLNDFGASGSKQSSGFGGLLGQLLGGGGGGGSEGSLGDLLARSAAQTPPKARARGAAIHKASAERVRQQEFENILASFVGSGVQPARPEPGDRSILSEFFGGRKRRAAPLH
uniref:Uncharacterized protein n=1 Tax=Plectus sambesii TaxID=2011161 RepID=A0A914WHU1_9BILA